MQDHFRHHRLSRWILALAAAASCAATAYAGPVPSYLVTRLDAFVTVSDINNSGQVIGTGSLDGSTYQGLSWKAGTYTALATQGGSAGRSQPMALNNNGVIVGSTDIALYAGDALRWNGTVPSTLASATDRNSHNARGINDAGQMVGTSNSYFALGPLGTDYRYVDQATVWSADGQATRLPYLGYPFGSGANAINRDGLIVGWANDDTGQRAALWSDASSNPVLLGSAWLDGPNGAQDEAVSINNNGLVVGYTSDAESHVQAELWFGDLRFDLGFLTGDNYSTASDINVNGQIVGVSGGGTQYSAVLWNEALGQATDLNDFMDTALRDQGWYFYNAAAINDDGSIVVNAYNRMLDTGGVFLLSVSSGTGSVPEPESLALTLPALLLLGALRRRAAQSAALLQAA